MGIEPKAFCLRSNCSTTKLNRLSSVPSEIAQIPPGPLKRLPPPKIYKLMTSKDEQRCAIPFIVTSKSKGFEITKEAEAYLQTLENRRLGIVSIAGKYRTGKSYFLNKLIQHKAERRGFEVGPTVNSCTKGIWLWPQTFKSENPDEEDMDILVLDTEGFGGINENQNHDNRIFIFSLLLSSMFIYNSIGSIDENALQTLSLIVNLAKNIQLGEAKEATQRHISESLVSDVSNDVSQLIRLANTTIMADNGEEAIAETFPFFLWVIRDFCLELKDAHGNPITSKTYFENALKMTGQGGPADSKNKIRSLIKHFFRSRDCVTMVRPVEKEADLQNLDNLEDGQLRPEFVLQIKKTRKMVMMKTAAKKIRGAALNGPKFFQLASAYVKAINAGAAPSVDNAWNYIVQFENEKKLRLIYSKLRNSRSMIRNQNEIDMLIESVFVDFENERIGSGEETEDVKKKFEAEVRQELEHDCSRFAETLKTAVREQAEEHLEELKKAVLDLETFDTATIEKLTEQHVNSIVEAFKGQASEADLRGLTEQLMTQGRSEVLQLALRQMEKVKAKEAKELAVKAEASERRLNELSEQLNLRVQQIEQRSATENQRFEELVRENQRLLAQFDQTTAEKDRLAARLRDKESELAKFESDLNETRNEETRELQRQIDQLGVKLSEKETNAQKESVLLNGKIKYLETGLQKAKMDLAAKDTEITDLKQKLAQAQDMTDDLRAKLKNQRTLVPETHVMIERAKWSEIREQAAAVDDLKENYEKVARELMNERDMIQNQFDFLKENFENEKSKNYKLLQEIHDKLAKRKAGDTGFEASGKENTGMCVNCQNRADSKGKEAACGMYGDAEPGVTFGNQHSDDPPEIIVTSAEIIKGDENDDLQSSNRKTTVMYSMDIRQNGKSWSVQKRFMDFFDLAVKLKRAIKWIELPPSAKEIWQFTRDIWGSVGSKSFPLETRKLVIEKMMRELAELSVIRRHSLFNEFLKEEQFKD